MPQLYDYHVVCHREDNGSYVAYVPALKGCHALGSSPAEAQAELENVFSMIADEFTERAEAMPADVELLIAHADQGS